MNRSYLITSDTGDQYKLSLSDDDGLSFSMEFDFRASLGAKRRSFPVAARFY